MYKLIIIISSYFQSDLITYRANSSSPYISDYIKLLYKQIIEGNSAIYNYLNITLRIPRVLDLKRACLKQYFHQYVRS